MAKSMIKPSDRGRNNPDPGPPPGGRAEQRDTAEQLQQATPVAPDPAVEWERDEQELLPPRGTGSQDNQGGNRYAGPRPEGPGDEAPPPAEPRRRGSAARGERG